MLDSYNNRLKGIIDSNINDRILGRNNFLKLLKPSALAFQPEKAILILFKFLNNSIRVQKAKITT